MERRNLFKLTGLAAAIMFSTGTLAASDQQPSFQELDQNRDGKLTPSELSDQPDMARQWNDIDKDNSNAIERSEFSAFENQQGQSGSEMASNKLPKFEELDHNGDGKLTTSEVKDEAALTAQWTEIDKDDSDTLDRSEFSAFEEQRQQRDLQQQTAQQQGQSQSDQQQGMQQETAQKSGKMQEHSGEMAATELPEFDKLDKDRDGKLSPQEVSDQPALATQWTEIDKDDSDTLDRSEFSAFEESYKSSEQMDQQKQSDQSEQQRQQSGQEGASTQSGAAAGGATAAAAGSKSMTDRGEINHPLYSMSPDELQGQEVMGSNGQKLGTISKVVSDRSSGRIHVVVSGGGFLGIASRENTVPLDDLQMEQGVLTAPVSEQEIEGRNEYTEDAYVEVQPEDRPISEFSAFEESATEDDSLRNPGESGQSDETKSSQYGQ